MWLSHQHGADEDYQVKEIRIMLKKITDFTYEAYLPLEYASPTQGEAEK